MVMGLISRLNGVRASYSPTYCPLICSHGGGPASSVGSELSLLPTSPKSHPTTSIATTNVAHLPRVDRSLWASLGVSVSDMSTGGLGDQTTHPLV